MASLRTLAVRPGTAPGTAFEPAGVLHQPSARLQPANGHGDVRERLTAGRDETVEVERFAAEEAEQPTIGRCQVIEFGR